MFKNIIKTTVRYFFKNGFFSLINVLGLAIGLTTCILIFLFVQDELSYDKHFNDAERIYRVEPRYVGHGEDSHWASSQGNLLPNLIKTYPEISEVCKLHFYYNDATVQVGDEFFTEGNVLVADTTFLDFFGLHPVNGSRQNALKGPETLVLTRRTALKYFGREDVVGEVIRLIDKNFKVTAVVEELPKNTHFHFDLAISMDEFRARGIPVDEGGPSAYYSYIKLADQHAKEIFVDKINSNAWTLLGYEINDASDIPEGWEASLLLNPVTGIHLNGHAEKEIEANSHRQYIYIFSLVAIFILIIASINYMNLTTAKSFKRGKEVGLRKVLGARKKEIFNQFMAESFFVVLLAVLISLLLTELFIPSFNELTGKSLELSLFSNPVLLLGIVLILLLVGFLSGSYPALFLSKFNPLRVLKGNTISASGTKSALYFRRGLVILQFSISVVLIIGTITVYKQLMYIQHKKLGFKKENVLLVKTSGIRERDKIPVLKDQLLKYPEIISASATSSIPGERVPFLTVRIPDMDQEDNEGNDEGDGSFGMRVMAADHHVIETFGYNIVDGRGFSEDYGTDAGQAYLVNQAAVKEYNLENPVGMRFEYLYALLEPKAGKIVGVIEDFHYASLHSDVEPLMIHINPITFRYLAVRTNSGDIRASLSNIENEWRATFAGLPFEYFFLDAYYNNLYRSEQNLKTIITYFSLLAVIVACLGLFGLAAYITEQRTKEVGIRKVLGASVSTIVISLSGEFLILVALANLIAWIPAYYLLNNWLDGFAFRTSLSFWIFALTAAASIVISVITVGMQAGKAARINPTKALRYE